jgi:hypothetical protein
VLRSRRRWCFGRGKGVDRGRGVSTANSERAEVVAQQDEAVSGRARARGSEGGALVIPLAPSAALRQRKEVSSLVVVALLVVVVDALEVVEGFILVELVVIILGVLVERTASASAPALRRAARLRAAAAAARLLPTALALSRGPRQRLESLLLLFRGQPPEGVEQREVEGDVLALPMRTVVRLAVGVAPSGASIVGAGEAEHVRPAEGGDADPEVPG